MRPSCAKPDFRQPNTVAGRIFDAEDLPLVAEYDLTCVIHSAQQIALLDAYPKRGTLNIWLKINSA